MTLQFFCVIFLVAAAVVYVVRRLTRAMRGDADGACMKCDCGDKKADKKSG